MKSTGVTRKIDELGRVVIPKEIRKNLGIRDGESLEIFTDEESIIFKKYSEIERFEDLGKKLCDLVSNIYKLNIIITDREKVISTSINTEIISKKLDVKLISLIDNRESLLSKEKQTLNFENIEVNGYTTIMPIIESSDSLGLIILLDENYNDNGNLAKLLARIIADKININ